jgi:hypothetical protein
VESEQCDECGFHGENWSRWDALGAIEGLPARWREAVEGLDPGELSRRPIDQM